MNVWIHWVYKGGKNMTYIINGAGGQMGKAIYACIMRSQPDAKIFSVDKNGDGYMKNLSEITEKADCIIDFSHHTATKELTDYAVRTGTPVVIATTGQTDDEWEMIRNAAKNVAVFNSGNMSVGIALLIKLAKQAAAAFPDADIEIVETHHNRKADAPSGTALMLANGIKEVRPDAEIVTGRSGYGKRTKNEIGVQSVRMGNVVGIHEVHINTGTQCITLKHEAYDRALFADGAFAAAQEIIAKPAGLYNMNDIL